MSVKRKTIDAAKKYMSQRWNQSADQLSIPDGQQGRVTTCEAAPHSPLLESFPKQMVKVTYKYTPGVTKAIWTITTRTFTKMIWNINIRRCNTCNCFNSISFILCDIYSESCMTCSDGKPTVEVCLNDHNSEMLLGALLFLRQLFYYTYT